MIVVCKLGMYQQMHVLKSKDSKDDEGLGCKGNVAEYSCDRFVIENRLNKNLVEMIWALSERWNRSILNQLCFLYSYTYFAEGNKPINLLSLNKIKKQNKTKQTKTRSAIAFQNL